MTPKRGEGAAEREKIEATRDEMIERAEGLRMAQNPLNPNPPSKALLEMTAMNNKSVDSVIRGIKQLAEAALEASSPSALIAAVVRLEREIFDCEQLEKDYSNRSQKELDDEWITADEIKHRIGGLKFALELLRAAPTEEVA